MRLRQVVRVNVSGPGGGEKTVLKTARASLWHLPALASICKHLPTLARVCWHLPAFARVCQVRIRIKNIRIKIIRIKILRIQIIRIQR